MCLNRLKSGRRKVMSIFSNCSKKTLKILTKLYDNTKCVRILHATLFKRSIIRIKESIASSFLPVPTNIFKISGSESLSKYILVITTLMIRTRIPHRLRNIRKTINLLGFHSIPNNNKKYFSGETAVKKRSFNSFIFADKQDLTNCSDSDGWYYCESPCL